MGDIGLDSIGEILQLIVLAYGHQQVLLRRIVSLTSGRPFQFCHRWRDRRRKLADPQDVTKYDVSDALQKLIS